MISEQN